VSFLVTDDTKSYQIFSRVMAEAVPRLDVMDLKAFDLPARLAMPAIPLEDFTAELAVSLGFKLQSRPLPFEPVQGRFSGFPVNAVTAQWEGRR
jgi:hypothetical protein